MNSRHRHDPAGTKIIEGLIQVISWSVIGFFRFFLAVGIIGKVVLMSGVLLVTIHLMRFLGMTPASQALVLLSVGLTLIFAVLFQGIFGSWRS